MNNTTQTEQAEQKTGYLLDANYIIHLSKDNEENQADKKAVLQHIQAVLQDEDSRLVVSPLIAYEALRGVAWQEDEELAEVQRVIDGFAMLDIDMETANLASDLYRFDVYDSQQTGVEKNFEKRKFDMFHFATAKVNRLEVLSKDKHIKTIKKMYDKMCGTMETMYSTSRKMTDKA